MTRTNIATKMTAIGKELGTGKSPVKSTAEQTRRLILDAAREEFADKGFSGTRIDVIAERAGVNKQALYYHFGSKEQLYQSVLEAGYSAIYERISEQLNGVELEVLSPEEAIRTLIQIYFDTMIEFQTMLEIIADENKHKGVHLKELDSIRATAQPFFVSLKRVVARGVDDGSFQKNLDSTHVWMAIISLCQFWWTHRYTLSHILAKDITSLRLIRERRKQVVEFVLSALRA